MRTGVGAGWAGKVMTWRAAAHATAAANPLAHTFGVSVVLYLPPCTGLRIKENKEVYEGEVTELTPEEAESQTGGYGKVIASVVIGLKSVKARRASASGSIQSLGFEGHCQLEDCRGKPAFCSCALLLVI